MFEAIHEMCPYIKALGILHCRLPIEPLSKFKSLIALELGDVLWYVANLSQEIGRIILYLILLLTILPQVLIFIP